MFNKIAYICAVYNYANGLSNDLELLSELYKAL